MKPLIKTLPSLLSGTEMIIPVNIIAETANMCIHNQHITPDTMLINGLMAYSVYKFDRYRDAQEFVGDDPKDLYKGIIENKNSIEFLLFSSSIFTLILLINYHYSDVLLLYLSTFLYKNIKKLDIPIKPFYVSGLWAVTACVVPSYAAHVDYKFMDTLPFFLNIFALTNMADITDLEEDISENVTTIPTIIGKNNTLSLCMAASALSCLLFVNLDYFTNNFLNDFFIFSNVVPYMNFTK